MGLIPYSKQSIGEEDLLAVERMMKDDFLTQGPQVSEFEKELAGWFGVKHAVACSSGTAALHLAYASLGIDENSIGIVPAVTFSATANALKYQGAKPIFCDVDPVSGLIDLESVEGIINNLNPNQKRGKNLIAPVSLTGSVAPLKGCRILADKHELCVVEEASHSPGAWREESDGNKTKSASGEWSDASTLSFHPVKHVCCGEGGAILTNSVEIRKHAVKLRSHGIQRPFGPEHETPWAYEQDELGWNYRLSDIHAALGRSQLKGLENSLLKRRGIAARYRELLGKKPFSSHFGLPNEEKGHAWHLFVLRFRKPGRRDQAHKFLKERGIMTQVHYVPLYRHPYFEREMGKIRLPGAEKFFEGCLSIPLFPNLTKGEQDTVVDEIARFIEKG